MKIRLLKIGLSLGFVGLATAAVWSTAVAPKVSTAGTIACGAFVFMALTVVLLLVWSINE